MYIFIAFGLVTIFCSAFMPAVSGEKIKIVESVCLRSITFFGMLAAILLASSSIPSDIEDKVLWTITTKPVSQYSFILGKVTGFVYIIGLLVLILGSASYALIKVVDSLQKDTEHQGLTARQMFEPAHLKITGKSAKKSGNIHWIEGEKGCASSWSFTGLESKNTSDKIVIESNMFVESRNNRKKTIPVNVKVVNHFTGESHRETVTVANKKPSFLRWSNETLGGGKNLTIVMTPQHSGDFLGIRPDSLRLFLGNKSFEYNFLKGLIVISAQFILMVVIATLGSTFFSLPVNILFCLFIFFCGNITDFMRDISTVITIAGAHEHDHEHGISAVVKKPSTFVTLLNSILTAPLTTLSYILPNFKKFNIGNYFIESINIPIKRIFASFVYMFLYIIFCLPISFIVFRKREFA
ncbi:MAG: hypothetical protein D8M57_09330 [Candidatus Scalindua sp. AMX11]|nr:MAG: hypothetical protein DWQ00_00440 [Candidatus Scalindua sp.]NOG83008.1 hypothetical protein [Planctomycetota bacterium]RZV79590.1 MAG: hypothetical protein EX341_11190 [Candidatus Scalindua sp. SCAELEC01]TDE65232.1 MAG: hypothetical protein D8M57_09330 [Candidatus Scalindua sp. AMX11]